MVLQIEQYITATATHIAIDNQALQSKNILLAAFLDAGMSILGSDPDKYDTYAGSSCTEYEFVVRGINCEKRAEILTLFLPVIDAKLY